MTTGPRIGLPRTDTERLARWEALVAAQQREILRLRRAAAAAARELRLGRDPGEVARQLDQRAQPYVQPDDPDEAA